MIALLLLACHKHPDLVPTWPGPQGRSCDEQHTLVVDPAPWGGVHTVGVGIGDGPEILGDPRQSLAVVPATKLGGVRVSAVGSQGQASCEVDLSRGIALVDCGPYPLAVHAPPLCDSLLSTEPLERVARPEVGNFIVAQKFGSKRPEPDVRQLWNQQEPAGLGERIARCEGACADEHALRDAMQHGLERLDGLDRFDDPSRARGLDQMGQGLDWCDAVATPEGPACRAEHPLRALFLDDGILVDTESRCTLNTRSFLEIELAHLQARPELSGKRHQTCGGRTPGDDVVDTLLTLTINGPERLPPGAPFYGPQDAEPDPIRGDGVNGTTAPASQAFPWLAPPQSDP